MEQPSSSSSGDGGNGGGGGGGNKKKEVTPSIPFYKLFSLADSLDVLLMVLDTVEALGNRVSLPLMTVIFGNMINSFGENSDGSDLIDSVSEVSI